MLLACLLLGDSTAIGTADALAALGYRCAVHARIGASSTESLRTFQGNEPVERAVIGIGSNDPTNPRLLRNLVAIRQRVSAVRVTWLAPYDRAAAQMTAAVAASFGDDVVDLSNVPARDRAHPQSYSLVASRLHWVGPPGTPRAMAAVPRAVPQPARVSVRRAVVMRF